MIFTACIISISQNIALYAYTIGFYKTKNARVIRNGYFCVFAVFNYPLHTQEKNNFHEMKPTSGTGYCQ